MTFGCMNPTKLIRHMTASGALRGARGEVFLSCIAPCKIRRHVPKKR